MSNEQDKKLKEGFEKVGALLQSKEVEMSAEQRAEFENIHAQMAGAMFRRWFPGDWVRRILMLITFVVSIYLTVTVSLWFILLLLIVGLFSPRLVGETLIIIGKAKKS